MMEEEKIEESLSDQAPVLPPVLPQEVLNLTTFEIRVLSLNVWGIPFVSTLRTARLEAICTQILATPEPYNFIMLQEIWMESDFKFVAEKLKSVLPFSHYFRSGVLGSGTCILSCSPLTFVHYYPWSINGKPHKVNHGDWWGGKGLGVATTNFKGCDILLGTTHLHATYGFKDDEYLHHRTIQAFETSQILKCFSATNHTIILAGDFNSDCNDVPYRLIRHNGQLRDTFCDAPNKPMDGIGATNGIPGNSFTPRGYLYFEPNGKRIDHIFYRPSASIKIKLAKCDLPWPLRVPRCSYSFSDHESVRAVFTVSTANISDSATVDSRASLAENDQMNNSLTKNGDLKNHALKDGQEETDSLHATTDALLDAAAICAQGLRWWGKSWKQYLASYLFFLLSGLIMFTVICSKPNMDGVSVFVLLMFLMVFLICGIYSLWLLMIFSRVEKNSLVATQASIESSLNDLRRINAIHYQKSSFSNFNKKTRHSK